MTQKSQLTLKSTLEQLKNGIEEEKEEQILQSIDKLIQQQQQQSNNKNNNNNNTTINKNILPLAQQCKIIYFIMKLDYQKALDYILNHNLNNNIFLIYKCYCLFRLNKLQDALNEIKNIKNDDNFILLHLKAQIYYRLGMYEESSKVYEEEILKNKQEEENEEILTNLIASYTLSNNKKALDIKPNINTYELEYNKACAYLHLLKDYQQAEKYLEFSVQLMKSSNNSNHGGEDSSGVDENELGSIMVQLAYVKYLKGNLKESQEICEEQLKKFTSKELVALAVAQNNLIALLDQQNTTINNNQTIMDESILKKLKFIFHEKMLNKLTMEQMKGVTLNHCLLLLKLNKLDECEKLVKEELIKLYNNENNNNIPNLILLSIYMKQNKNLNYLMNNYKLNNLTKIQIYLNLEKYKEIIEIINNDNELNNYLSIKCLLIFIYMKLNNYDKCIELYLNLLKENNNLDKSILLNIGNLCCDLQLKLKKYNDATDTLKLLLKLDKNNYTILSKLIQVLTFIDLNQAEHYLNELSKNHHINITSTTLNVDELEKTSINTLLNTTTSNATTTLSATTGSNNTREKVNVRQKDALERGEKRKKTKKRKNKLPKEMNGEVPDPLRWESKKVNKKEATGVGHQGSADTDKQGKLHHAKGQKSILKPEEILPKGVKKQGGSRKKR
ncbi:hypothetical protein ABK040_009681 [Willaertia magna]